MPIHTGRSWLPHALALITMAALGMWPTVVDADEPITERASWDGNIDYFMTGATLAADNDDDNKVETNISPVSFDVTSTDVPSTSTLVNGYLYWAGTQSQPMGGCSGLPDDTVELTVPGGSPTSITADVCYCADGGASSYDVWVCRKEVTSMIGTAAGDMIGTYTVGEYTGDISNGSTDNASTALLVVVRDTSLAPRRVVLYDGDVTMRYDTQTITLSGFTVDTTPIGKLTYYTLEGDIGGSSGEMVTVDGTPGPAGPLQLTDGINPLENPMNRTINTTTPTQTDVVGVDIDEFDISSALTAGDTAADIEYTAGSDKWWIAVNVVGINTFDPNFAENSSKSWTLLDDADGDGEPSPGDTIRYTIHLENTGNEEGTTDVIDTIPPEAASWTLIDDGGGTDMSGGGDLYLTGITVAAGSSVDIVFDVVIDDVADLTDMDNTADWSAPPEGGEAGSVTAPTVTIRRDRDGDGVYDSVDNCPDTPNPTQEDSDGDGEGDACEPCPDSDGDTFFDASCGGQDCDDNDENINPNATELCDGVDNDCDAGTADGSQAAWFGNDCDGADADLCDEGTWQCVSGTKTCSDTSGDNLELCDGLDNDCNSVTVDGSDESWHGNACDGPDSDACEEGTFECSGGAQTCTDTSGDNLELCDGVNNDCDDTTADGADESWVGDSCDGPDSDACEEGSLACQGGAQTCTDTTGDDVEICDGLDNDCDPTTADGEAEPWLGNACDGADSDLCEEGNWACSGGNKTCTDTTSDDLELCDGVDNDCDGSTADGSDESWYGMDCDGSDSDKCDEGIFTCSGSTQTCTDTTGDDLEVCDGVDNDCDPNTDDGADESWLNTACDGPDSDLCEEGTNICSGGNKTCTDTSGDDIEICDGVDNDCDATTPDGAAESWVGDPCDGADTDLCNEGNLQCSGGNQVCTDTTDNTLDLCDGMNNDCDASTPDGAHEPWLGDPCDGMDGDFCEEGVYECQSGMQACTDSTPSNVEVCDGDDDNCDGVIDEGCSCINDETRPCYTGPAGTEGVGICTGGTQTCSGGAWGTCDGEVTPQAEVCDGVDNDCDTSTPDGADETGFGDACDGNDSDLCEEGTVSCNGTSLYCSDTTTDDLEVCDGNDNDCDPNTPDGADEAWINTVCDGPDSDLCAEGVNLCVSGGQVCSDTTADTLDICDGANNDCNPATADGSDETWYQTDCDGADSDLCEEGIWECSGAAKTCSDTTTDDLEVCDGNDNDCNAATLDGADEMWLGMACDGLDADLCPEGAYQCVSGAQACTDTTGDNAEICDGNDNDCNPATADGTDESWIGADCDGNDSDLCKEGTFQCSSGSRACSDTTGDDLEVCDGNDNDCNPVTADGADETWLNVPCDGPDADLCEEGVEQCVAGARACSDNSGDTVEVCDMMDNDCDGTTDEDAGPIWYRDADTDTFGTPDDTTQACDQPAGYVPDGGDCLDTNKDINPLADEICDGLDNDCDPLTADGTSEPWIGQACDGDDTDVCKEGVLECTGTQTCSDTTDDDIEVCDGMDNDCDDLVDLDDPDLVDDDIDGDGVVACADCDDEDADNFPGNNEVCDGKDNDCDGEALMDEVDLDGDGFRVCDGDCNDDDDTVYPDAEELCDGKDNNCDDFLPKEELVKVSGHFRCEFTLNPDEDFDGDGLTNGEELELGTDPASADSDGDTIDDYTETDGGLDNIDSDQDGTIDAIDDDDDGDGIPTGLEIEDGALHGDDIDDDGTPNHYDIDSDGDGISDNEEAGENPEEPVDTDEDGIPDYLDTDSDDDGVPDAEDNCRVDANPDQTDEDGNGFGDICSEEDCLNGMDDNDDGLIDCEDPLCVDATACLEICDNGVDDDGNGATDCDDEDCIESPLCMGEDVFEAPDVDAGGDAMVAERITLDEGPGDEGSTEDCACRSLRAADGDDGNSAPLGWLPALLIGALWWRRRRSTRNPG